MTPETARLLQHWCYHRFSGIRPFFCQVKAVFWRSVLFYIEDLLGRPVDLVTDKALREEMLIEREMVNV